ncbi:MAG TPA: septation protein SepH [Nocardioidaceae bacterium]|nr:septation protein SepH [Nocardioidaceae bacterium]
MQDLTLVGLTEDKTKLVLVSDSGEKFTLPADGKLRAALRGDHARLGQLEKRMDSALRPRDIQARIRSGETPEDVAQAAQTTVERIMSYATPVLAERAHIADRAQRASIRRRGGEGPARILGDAVAEQLRSRNVDPESVDWDSWRREDGRWTLVAGFRTDDRSRHAEFLFDVQGRYVVAEDDEARWLVGEQPVRRPQPPQVTPPPTARRLSAVGIEQELPLGDDAIELVAGADDEAPSAPEEATVDLTQTARDLRGRTTARAGELGATGDADWMATQASDRPHRLPEEAPEPDAPPAPEDKAASTATAEAAETEEASEPEPPPKKTGRKGRRASVPSWDEIMFGGGRSE